MKRRKSLKQKLAEISYKRPALEKKMNTIEKSIKEVNNMLNENK